MNALPPRLSLWTAVPGAAPAAEEVAALTWLDAAERRRHQALRVPGSQWSFAAAHALTRHALARRCGRPAAGLAFSASALGRPLLLEPPPDLPADGFSLSHTRGAAACVLFASPAPPGACVGCDVEAGTAGADVLALGDMVFHPLEMVRLRAAEPGPARQGMFLALWTLKEALAKALGMGFQTPFTAFAVDPWRLRLEVAPPPFAPAEAWRLWRGTLAAGTAWAVAARGVGGACALEHQALSGLAALHPAD